MGNFKETYFVDDAETLTAEVHQAEHTLWRATLTSTYRGEIHNILFSDFSVAVEAIKQIADATIGTIKENNE